MKTEFGKELYESIVSYNHNETRDIKFKPKKEDLYIETNCYPIYKINH